MADVVDLAAVVEDLIVVDTAVAAMTVGAILLEEAIVVDIEAGEEVTHHIDRCMLNLR